MVHISREEVIKLARLSRISLHPDEVDPMCKRLQQVLEYAACVSQAAGQQKVSFAQNVNILRDDVVVVTNSEPLLNQAPDEQDHLFVVPSIIQNS
jgi:aspartyl/glutamyl-tRNA(Asn/Gln) amidotransferase C subunit